MIRILALLAAFGFASTMSVADAKTCRDPKTGKFTKCVTPAATPKPKHCRDPKTGKFIKCTMKEPQPYLSRNRYERGVTPYAIYERAQFYWLTQRYPQGL